MHAKMVVTLLRYCRYIHLICLFMKSHSIFNLFSVFVFSLASSVGVRRSAHEIDNSNYEENPPVPVIVSVSEEVTCNGITSDTYFCKNPFSSPFSNVCLLRSTGSAKNGIAPRRIGTVSTNGVSSVIDGSSLLPSEIS